MGKTGRWLRNILTGKKEKKAKEREKEQPPTPTTPKEKRRWSFRRSSAPPKPPDIHIQNEPKKHVLPAPAPHHKAATKIQAVFRTYLVRLISDQTNCSLDMLIFT